MTSKTIYGIELERYDELRLLAVLSSDDKVEGYIVTTYAIREAGNTWVVNNLYDFDELTDAFNVYDRYKLAAQTYDKFKRMLDIAHDNAICLADYIINDPFYEFVENREPINDSDEYHEYEEDDEDDEP